MTTAPLLRRARVWLLGLATASILLSTYGFSRVFRAVWQSHYPELASQWDNNGRFTVLGLYGTLSMGDELGYAARVNEASRKWLPFDPYIKENRSVRMCASDFLQYFLMGLPARLIKDISTAWIAILFVCSWLWFVLTHHLARKLELEEPVAAFCGAFIACFSYVLIFMWITQVHWAGTLARTLAQTAWALLSYGRTEGVLRAPRPAVNYAVMFFSSLLNIKAAESKRWSWAVAAGLVVGLSAYVRLDSWTTCLLASWIFAAAEWFAGRFSPRLFLAAVTASLVSLPWVLLNYPADPGLAARMGILTGSYVNWSALVYLAGFALALRFRRARPAALFMGSMLAAVAVMLNAQLVTGMAFWPFYWVSIGNLYFFMLLLTFLPASWRRAAGPWRAATAAVLAAAFLQGVGYAAIHYPFQGLPRDYDAAFRWLNDHTKPDSVVLALNPEINFIVPVFTHDTVAIGPAATAYSDYPMAQNFRRLLQGLDLMGADRARFLEDAISRNRTHGRNVSKRGELEKSDIYLYYFHLLEPGAVREGVQRADAHLETPPLAVDYLWLGNFEKSYQSPRRAPGFPGFVEAYRNDSVILYARP